MAECTWKKVDGRWQCQAKQCEHWKGGGVCGIGKVSLSCDNNDCKWNGTIGHGIYVCQTMDVHLDADGKCLGLEDKLNSINKENSNPNYAVGNQKIQNQPLGPS